MSFTDEQKRALRQPMPREHVATRDGGGGKALSYIEGHLVMREMNDIFDPGGWSYDCTPTLVCEYEAQGKNGGPQWRVTYTSRCILKVRDCTIVDVGAGHGIDRDRGSAHESAIKEAATDSLKRCCKTLGDRLGLALYDKQQARVVDTVATVSAHDVEALINGWSSVTTRGEWDAANAATKALWQMMDDAQRADVTKAIEIARGRGKQAK